MMSLQLSKHDHTARLCLRAPTWQDLPDITAIHADPATNQHNPAGPTPPEQSRVMLDDWLADWRAGVGYWCVRLAEEGAVIGVAGIRRTGDDHTYNLYYRFAASTWGKGYATEAASHAVQKSQQDRFATVQALIVPANRGSIAVAERVGLSQVTSSNKNAGDQSRYVISGSNDRGDAG